MKCIYCNRDIKGVKRLIKHLDHCVKVKCKHKNLHKLIKYRYNYNHGKKSRPIKTPIKTTYICKTCGIKVKKD